ncbi:hypothetical protein [Trinickia dinghuensis]|uniref:hypothetical protein n=1 Tax=Trinickia dinghuensis TaxID=2291023 RepID=UPI0011C056BD|nr:hypothetical protein [Trinickia dinghuensis]
MAIALFAAFNYKPIQSAADAAAWVQGIGSLLAITAAIWIYAKQCQNKKSDDNAEIRAFVEAIREEVQAAWTSYCVEIHPALRALPDGQHFKLIYPVSTEGFTIYNNSALMVGKVSDPELRRSIIHTYALAKSLVYSFHMNNIMLNEYRQLLLMYHQADREAVLTAHIDSLRIYATKLKERDTWISQAAESLQIRIDQWLAASR